LPPLLDPEGDPVGAATGGHARSGLAAAKTDGTNRKAGLGLIHSRQRDMRIGQNPPIHRHPFTSMIPRGGEDDLISRVAMKFTRQTTGVGDNVWREFEELHAWIGKGSVKPLIRWHRQFQPTSLHQFYHLPAGDGTHSDVLRP
jgi:hypothetical protein